MELADLFRNFVLGVSGIILVLAVVTLWYYAKANRVSPRNEPSLLHHHVMAISGSYLLLLGYGVFDLYSRFGEKVNWRSIVLTFSSALAAYALIQVLRFERHRVDFRTGKVKISEPEND